MFSFDVTGVNPAGDAGEWSGHPLQYFDWGDVNGNIPTNIRSDIAHQY